MLRVLHILVYGMLFLMIVSCTRPNKTLLLAEELMNEKPDSALLLLEQIPVESLSHQQYADWCLLMTQAQDKCNIDLTSDSLIRIAVNYYEKRNSNPERQLLTFYYMGRV